MASHSRVLTDREEIRQWAEERGAKPACVQRTGQGEIGMIRLEFPGAPNANDANLDEIGWDDFFGKFEESDLALLVQDELASGGRSNFNKLVSRETAEAAGRGSGAKKKSASKSGGSRGGAAKKSSAKSGAKSSAKKKSASKSGGSRSGASKSGAKKSSVKKSGGSGAKKSAKSSAKSSARSSAGEKSSAKKSSGKSAGKKSGMKVRRIQAPRGAEIDIKTRGR
ncbi:MAG: hypothetical protein JOZ43_06940 [Acidobacteriales bacterium]|nr:hypothetical protein [Terriglobales bacterium]